MRAWTAVMAVSDEPAAHPTIGSRAPLYIFAQRPGLLKTAGSGARHGNIALDGAVAREIAGFSTSRKGVLGQANEVSNEKASGSVLVRQAGLPAGVLTFTHRRTAKPDNRKKATTYRERGPALTAHGLSEDMLQRRDKSLVSAMGSRGWVSREDCIWVTAIAGFSLHNTCVLWP